MLRSIEPSQYLAIRYTERLAQEGAVISVGSRGDSYDNALAETINGLYKAEVIYGHGQGPWRTVEDVKLATCRWVHWWNHRRAAVADRRHPAGRVRGQLATRARRPRSVRPSEARHGLGWYQRC